jgi:hypothetical protein
LAALTALSNPALSFCASGATAPITNTSPMRTQHYARGFGHIEHVKAHTVRHRANRARKAVLLTVATHEVQVVGILDWPQLRTQATGDQP